MPAPEARIPVSIRYIGGPTAIVEIAGLRFLTDPTFSAPAAYPSGALVLHKTEGPALSADEIGPIDAILLSHDQHADNLDPAGRALVERLLTLTTLAGAQRLGPPSVGLAPWQTHDFQALHGIPLRVTATPARHGPAGIEPLAGEVIGFLISALEPARDLLYITGDTVWFRGVAEVAERFDPGAILLFAGAASTRGPFHLTMNTNDAVELAAAFPRAAIVPIHHSGWKHFTQSQDDLIKTFAALGLAHRLHPVSPAEAIHL